MSLFDERNAEATLEWQQRELAYERLNLAQLDLLARAFRTEAMQVGVVAMLDLQADCALAARPIGRVLRQAQQSRGKVQTEWRLTNARWTYQQQRERRLFGRHGSLARGNPPVLPTGPQFAHGSGAF